MIDLNKQIIAELRKQINGRVLSEDVVNEAIIFIDPVPGKGNAAKYESTILVSGLEIAAEQILRDVSGNEDGDEHTFEYVANADIEPGHLRFEQDEEEGVQTPIPQFLPKYSELVSTKRLADDGEDIATLNKQIKCLSPGGGGEEAMKAMTVSRRGGKCPLPTALSELGTLTMSLPEVQALRDRLHEKFTELRGRRKMTEVKSPWMLFIDWLWLAMKRSGLKPLRNRGFDGDPIYGMLGVTRWQRQPSSYSSQVSDVNAMSSLHDMTPDEFAVLQKKQAEHPEQVGAGELLRLYGRMLRTQDIKPAKRKSHDYIEIKPSEFWRGVLEPGEEPTGDDTGGRIGEEKIKATQIRDEFYTVEYVTKSLGTTHFEVAKKFIALLQNANPPKWFKLSLDSNEESLTYGRIYVSTKMRVAGYEAGPSKAREPEPAYPYPAVIKRGGTSRDAPDYAPRGKVTLPDQEYDQDTGQMTNVGPGTQLDTDELLAKAQARPQAERDALDDSEWVGQQMAASVRQWSRPPAELGRVKDRILRMKAELHELIRSGAREEEVDRMRDMIMKATREYRQQIEDWEATKTGGYARMQRAKARSHASHATTGVRRAEHKASIFRTLMNGGTYTVRKEGNKIEKEVDGIMKKGASFGLEPPEIRMAVRKYLEQAGYQSVDDIDGLDWFNALSDEDKNRILHMLEQAEAHFLLELGHLAEAVRIWMDAIAEGSAVKISSALRLVENVASNLPPVPATDAELQLEELFNFRRRNKLVREFLRDNPNVYAAVLALRGFNQDRILHILADHGLMTELSLRQLMEIREAQFVPTDSTIMECVSRANAITQTVCRIDRPAMAFNRIIANIGVGELRYLSTIVPQQVIDHAGYLNDIPTEMALKALGTSTSTILSNSKKESFVSEAFWRKCHRHLQFRP